MSEVAPGLQSLQALDLDELLAQVEALRSKGGDGTHGMSCPDPVRLHFIEAMARRLQAATPAVQAVLQAKLANALTALGEGLEADDQLAPKGVEGEASEAPSVGPEPLDEPAQKPAPRKTRSKVQQSVAVPPSAPLSLLGQLNSHIESASCGSDPAASSAAKKTVASPTRPQDLRSTVRFRETWARISAEAEVDQAKHRAPENAGPLNAHNLVLRTLGLMRELSPDYLRRFMSHSESLMWLDQAVGQLKQPVGKSKLVRAVKPKK